MFKDVDVSVGGWFVFSLLSGLPIINLIFWVVLLVDDETNTSLKNLLKFNLIMLVIGVVIMIMFWGSLQALLPNF